MDNPLEQQPLPKGKLYEAAMSAQRPEELRAILMDDLRARAFVRDDREHPFNPEAPFIVYEPMNLRPESGVALLLGRLALLERGVNLDGPPLLVPVPQSGTWIGKEIVGAGVFPGCELTSVSKQESQIPEGKKPIAIPVLSYAHGRLPDGTRTAQTIYLSAPERVAGRTVLLLDDVVAEGETILGLSRALRDLGASRIEAAVVVSKSMQGGSERIRQSGLVDRLIEGAVVVGVAGPGRGTLIFSG